MSPERRKPLWYPPETILTAGEVAEWLDVSEKTVLGLPLPRLRLGGKLVRYSARAVLEYLEGKTDSQGHSYLMHREQAS